MRPAGSSHDVIHKLYHAARAHFSAPLALHAARELSDQVHAGDFVIIATGAGHPLFLPEGEPDGPLGAVALARILSEGINAIPVIVTEQANVNNIRATAIAGGLGVRSLSEIPKVAATTDVLPFPNDDETADQVSRELLDQLQPTAVITIEKLGPNAAGVTRDVTRAGTKSGAWIAQWRLSGIRCKVAFSQ
jgi:D-glutamate cyclase